MPANELKTRQEAAKYLDVTDRTVINIVGRGELTPIFEWKGKRRLWRFKQSDLERYAAELEVMRAQRSK
jgi:excisionase family DNA binding protein